MRTAAVALLSLALLGTLPPLPTLGAPAPAGRPLQAQAPSDPAGRRASGGVQGVVLAQSGVTFTILARGNALLTVIVAGTAAVSGRDARPGREELGIARASVVEVAGPRNSDGSISAQSLIVLFDARRAARAGGRIVRPAQDGGIVLSDGTVVALGEDLWVFRGTTLLSAGVLAPGVAVTIYGTARGGRFLARVIEVPL